MSEVVLNARPSEEKYEALVVEKKLFCDCQYAALVVEKEANERQLPEMLKQPAAKLIPFAAVVVAEPVIARFRSETPPEKVDVDVFVTERLVIVVGPAASVPVAIRLPPKKAWPATSSLLVGEVVPMPTRPEV